MSNSSGGSSGLTGGRQSRRFSHLPRNQNGERGINISGPIGPVLHNGVPMTGDRFRNSIYVGGGIPRSTTYSQLPSFDDTDEAGYQSDNDDDDAPGNDEDAIPESSGSRTPTQDSPFPKSKSLGNVFSGRKSRSVFPLLCRKAGDTATKRTDANQEEGELPVGMVRIVPDPCPTDPQYVSTAMPSEYWSGRFAALHDQYHNELLDRANMKKVLDAHSQSSVSRDSTSSSVPSAHGLNNPSTSVYGSARSRYSRSHLPSSASSGAIMQQTVSGSSKSVTQYNFSYTSTYPVPPGEVPARKAVGSGLRPPSQRRLRNPGESGEEADVEDNATPRHSQLPSITVTTPLPALPNRETPCPSPEEIATMIPPPLFTRVPQKLGKSKESFIPTDNTVDPETGLMPAPLFATSRILTSGAALGTRAIAGSGRGEGPRVLHKLVTKAQERSKALADVLGVAPDPLDLEDEDFRSKLAFSRLQSICTSDVARKSLSDWQLHYARRVGKPCLLPVGGTMEDLEEPGVTYGFARIGRFFRSGSTKVVTLMKKNEGQPSPPSEAPPAPSQTSGDYRLSKMLKEQRARRESVLTAKPGSSASIRSAPLSSGPSSIPKGGLPSPGTLRSMSSGAIGLGATNLDGIDEVPEEEDAPLVPPAASPAGNDDIAMAQEAEVTTSGSDGVMGGMRTLRKKISQRFSRL